MSAKSLLLTEDCAHVVSGRLTVTAEKRAKLALSINRNYCRLEQELEKRKLEASVSGLFADRDLRVSFEDSRLTIHRDRFGRLPLYWCLLNEGELLFATSLKVMQEIAACRELKVDTRAFYTYACFSFVPAPLSPYCSINALAADNTLVCEFSGEKIQTSIVCGKPWYKLSETKAGRECDLLDELKLVLSETVLKQSSDLQNRKLAVFLSGGLDSALTAALLAGTGLKLTAYSLDFSPYGKSELPVAQEIADYLKIPLVKVHCRPRDVQKSLKNTIEALDGIYGDGVSVPLYLLCKKAAEDGQEVVFNGEGGDQLFGGWTNKPLVASTVYGVGQAESEQALYEVYLKTFHKIHGFEKQVFSPEILQEVGDLRLQDFLLDALEPRFSSSLVHLLRRANLMLKGAQNIQPRASNLAICFGLKLRSLFCCAELAEWTFSISPENLLRGACEKYILKKAAETVLPAHLVYREKRGMGVPLTEWCLGPLWPELACYLNEKRLLNAGYWQEDIAFRIALGSINAAWQGRRIGEILWLILNFEAWLAGSGDRTYKRYNSFWPPYELLKLQKEVLESL